MNGPGCAQEAFTERRRFCRIDDEVILHFRRVEDAEEGLPESPVLQESTPAFLVCSQLAEQRRQMHSLRREIKKESPAIFRYLAALEEKLDLVVKALMLDSIGAFADLRRKVELSASGIAFHTAAPLEPNARLLLEIILLPSLAGVVTHARVVQSTRKLRAHPDRPFLTVVEFIGIRESTRDLIAKHVLERQSSRQRRESA